MISKSFVKFANSLRQKGYREESQRFIAEGEKVCTEFLREDWNIEHLVAKKEWIEKNPSLVKKYSAVLIEASDNHMEKLSSLVTPASVMLIVETRKWKEEEMNVPLQLHLALDNIQ